MKKRKQLISSLRLETWSVFLPDLDCPYDVHLVEYTQLKSGIKMYSLDLGYCPVIFCDSRDFLSNVMNFDNFAIFNILYKIALVRGFPVGNLNFESEE